MEGKREEKEIKREGKIYTKVLRENRDTWGEV